jgi:peroxiredoxin
MMKSLLTLALIGLLLLSPLGGHAANQGPASTAKPIPLKAGAMTPDFKLKTPQGKSLSLRSFRGKPVLINFWATWCGPCVEEMHILQQIFQEWSAKGLIILGINEGDPVNKVTGFIQRYGIAFPVLMDDDQEVAHLFSVRYMPTSVLLDKDGVIQVVAFGGFETKEQLVSRMLSKIIK